MGAWRGAWHRRICWLLYELTGILLSRGEGGRILLRSVIVGRSWAIRVRIGRWLAKLSCHGRLPPLVSHFQAEVLLSFEMDFWLQTTAG